MKNAKMIALLAAAGTTCTVSAQDSTATSGSTDALGAYDTTQQLVEYVVDMDTFFSSKGKSYGIAPIIKASQPVSGTFSTQLISGNQLSRLRSSTPVAALNGPYTLWDIAGAGVNSATNSGPTSTVSAPGDASYLGVTFTEFNGAASNLISGQIGYSPTDPSRLYVSRAVAAVNSNTNGATGNAAFATGAIDEAGQALFRADDNGATGSNPIAGNNHLRVDLNARDFSTINSVDNAGGSDSGATTDVIRGDARVLSPAQSVPTALGGPALFLPTAFSGGGANSNLVYEVAPGNTPAVTSHRGPAPAHRGTVGMLPEGFFSPSDVITAGILSKDGSADDQTTGISVWGADANGQPTAAGTRFTRPDSIVDPAQGRTLFPGEYMHVGGGTPFRGGISQVALGTNLDGDLLIAAWANALTMAVTPPPNGDDAAEATVLVVGKVPAAGGATEWSVAGWLDPNFGDGKDFTDENGVAIGQLANQGAIGGGAVPPGTNSAPAFDSAGNLYWVQAVRENGDDGQPFTGDDNVTTGIIRANYVDDADGSGNFGYDLERLVRFEDVFESAGTGFNWSFTFLSSSDGSGRIATNTVFSNSVTAEPQAGATITDASDAETLGGLIFVGEITYDVNGDGLFVDGDDLDPDQDYQVVLYLHPVNDTQVADCNNNGVDDATDIANGTSNDFNADGVPDECQLTRLCADVNNDGIVNSSDFFAWVNFFGTSNPSADVNNNGTVDSSDFFAWVNFFNLGQNGPLCPVY